MLSQNIIYSLPLVFVSQCDFTLEVLILRVMASSYEAVPYLSLLFFLVYSNGNGVLVTTRDRAGES